MRATIALVLLAGAAAAAPCDGVGTAIVVDTAAGKMTLCEAGAAAGEYAVAVGRGGRGKRDEGDRKTPLGDYPLGAPRRSKEFGWFIPIGYPTAAQRTRGLSGSAVGIHGPKRRWAWLGRANAWANWTRGCVAVATDEDLDAVLRWARAKKPAMVRLR